MKSSIKIDLDSYTGTEPVIRIVKENTDDLRDKFVSKFIERLEHNSNLCFIHCSSSTGIWDIHSVPGTREGFKKYLSQCSGDQVKMIQSVCAELIASYPVIEEMVPHVVTKEDIENNKDAGLVEGEVIGIPANSFFVKQ
jgi:hypothetical protein